MPMTEDLGAFFRSEEFATTVRIDGQPANAIVDRAYAEVFNLQTVEPMATMPEAVATALGVDEGSTLVVPAGQINAGTYKVRLLHSDGTGVVILLLEVA